MQHTVLWFLGLLLATSTTAYAGPPANKKLTEAAQHFLSLLNDTQQQAATYPLDDEERYNWHFTPRERQGVPLNNMTEAQQEAALQLMKICLSEAGYEKAMDIRELEQVLRYVENRPPNDTRRDPMNYAFTVFGEPRDGESRTGKSGAGHAWGWRVEGHHLSLNYTAIDNKIVSATPTFLGANPGRVPSGPKEGWRVLQPEEDLGRELVKLLSEAQLRTALIAEEAYPEIVTDTKRYAKIGDQEGLRYADMSAAQQDKLVQLLDLYYNVHRAEVAEAALAPIKADLESIYFTWAGGLEVGDPHYYRLHGPTFVIEYDNTQNNANHIHTVIRDLQNDWGEDVLGKHYEEAHQR
jgi:hypothetical protein